MANMKRFRSKFTGAKARLFARVCRRYFGAAENACNDTPEIHPIFSWLSPQQRIQLVHEVMVGLLCPDEPLPPETIQHYTAYLALVSIIQLEIAVELDTVQETEVGDDLLHGYDGTDHDARLETPEENEERIRNMDLIARQAEKNKKKIDRADTRPVEAFHVPAEEDTDSNIWGSAQRVSATKSVLYS
jgi:hypothetical protein